MPNDGGDYSAENDGGDDNVENDGENVERQQQSEHPLIPFTCVDDFMHWTQDEDHDSKRVDLGIGAIGKPYRGR